MSATKAALHVLVRTAVWARNRVKAVDAGPVPVLVDMLFDDGAECRACEVVLMAAMVSRARTTLFLERVTVLMLRTRHFWSLDRVLWKSCRATVYSCHCGMPTLSICASMAGCGSLVRDDNRLGTQIVVFVSLRI